MCLSLRILTGTWNDCPHLTDEVKDSLYSGIPPYMRDARTKGIPVLGSGLIYPIAEEDIAVDDFPITDKFPRGYGMDVGWNRTAVGWFAQNPETKVIYIHDSHYQGGEQPAVHSAAIRSRGAWIPGVIDPRSDGRSQIDGKQAYSLYTQPVSEGGGGLDLTKADNSITTGIDMVWQMLDSGMLKVFRSIAPFWSEIRQYRREANENETGKIVKKNDHFMDLVRYFVVSGIDLMKVRGQKISSYYDLMRGSRSSGRTWMSGG